MSGGGDGGGGGSSDASDGFDEVEEEEEPGPNNLWHDMMEDSQFDWSSDEESSNDSHFASQSTGYMPRLAPDREANAIHLAAFLGWPPAVLWILETADAPFDINILDPVSRMPLSIAVAEENWDVVDVILSHGGSINFLDKAGHNILRHAAKSNKVDIIKRLITTNLTLAPDPAPALAPYPQARFLKDASPKDVVMDAHSLEMLKSSPFWLPLLAIVHYIISLLMLLSGGKLWQPEKPAEGPAEKPGAIPENCKEQAVLEGQAASEAQASTPAIQPSTYLQLMLAAGLGDIGAI